MELEKIEEELRKMTELLDKATRLEAVMKEEGEYRVILSKGVHSDRAVIQESLMEDFLKGGKGGQEIRKALGKVISKLTLLNQKKR